MWKLLKTLKPSWQLAAVIVVLVFAQTLGTLYIPTLMAEIVNRGIVQGDVAQVFACGMKMLLAAVGVGAAAIGAAYLASRFAAGLDRLTRNRLFQKVQTLSVDDFESIGTASMITRSTSDVTAVSQAVMMCLQMLLPAPIMIIGGLLLAFGKDPYMALVIGITMVGLMLLAAVMGFKVLPLFERLQKDMDRINGKLREVIGGVRVIRAFNRADDERENLQATFAQYAETAITVNKLFALLLPLVMLMMNGCTLALIYFGGHRVAAGAMAIGDIMALVEYALLILYYLIMGVMVFIMLPKAQACAGRIMAVLEITPQIADGQDAPTQRLNSAPKLAFEAVTFRYPEAEAAVLENISFTAHSGQTIAIIGGTGSGKSTIANLLLRFYDVAAGRILLDGVDIRQFNQQALRKKIAYVPQKALLFSGSIADNLRYGDENADEARLRQAAETACAWDFIEGLPLGLDSVVEQGGRNFSGGQKQRLSIARALVKPADIYVFDDSFSALDYQTDAQVRRGLKQMLNDKVVLIVAQRISTIKDADRILVLDEGRAVGWGTHEQLLQDCAVYQQIAVSQMREEEWA